MRIVNRSWVLLSALVLVAGSADGATLITDIDAAGNADGFVQPSEIAVKDRLAIAVYAKFAGLDMRAPMSVKQLLIGQARYYKSLSRPRLPQPETPEVGQRTFGPVSNSKLRGFGKTLPDELVTTPYHEARAASIMRYVDLNRDGFMTPGELEQSRYISYQLAFFRHDRNNDNRLSVQELSLYYYARDNKTDLDEIRESSVWTIEGVEVSPAQRDYGDKLMQRYDRNQDGFADRDELPESWARGWPLEAGDTNHDARLSRDEMYRMRALYERRRSLSRAESAVRSEREEQLLDAADDLAEFLIPRHATGDRDDRSVLRRDRGDLQAFDDEIEMADVNHNGSINEVELREWLTRRIETQGIFDLPPDLPLWFVESDLNGDQQVELAEFLKTNQLEELPEFERCDADRDGIVTPAESGLTMVDDQTIQFESASPLMVMGGQKVSSEIFVNDDFVIADLDIQIGIIKEKEDNIDLRVVSPDGVVATLLIDSRRLPWSSGRVFRNSILDDEASGTRRPRPPLDRRWRPQSVGKEGMESLDVFYGKPIKGRWALVIENNTGEACLLEGWALLAKRVELTDSNSVLEQSTSLETDSSN